MSATQHHTRASCDECGDVPATRETPAGVFCETCEPDEPRAANDDTRAPSCALPLCTRCQSDPAFFRLKEGDLCSACFAICNSVASPPQDAKVTAAAPSALSQAAAAVTPLSKEPDVLALLFCGPFARSSDITKGDRPGTELTALEIFGHVRDCEIPSRASAHAEARSGMDRQAGLSDGTTAIVAPVAECASRLADGRTSAAAVVPAKLQTSGDDGVTGGESAAPSFSSLKSFSGIGSARETSAMLHPGAVDGSTTKLAGRDSGDSAERRSPNLFPDCIVCSAFGRFGPSKYPTDLEHDAGWHELPEFIEDARARAAALNSTCGGGDRTRAAIGDRKPVTVSAPLGSAPESASTDSGRGSSEGKSPSQAGRPGPQDSIATGEAGLYKTSSCGDGETLAATRSAHRIKCTGETRRTRAPDSGEGGFPRRICAPQELTSQSVSASAPPPSTADALSKLATLRRDAVFSSADPGACGFDFEAEVSALEKSGVLNGPVYFGIDLASGPDTCVAYDPATRTFVDIADAENSKSVAASN